VIGIDERRTFMSQWRMLVVEDDPNGQELATVVLEHRQIQVDVARTAEDGLKLLDKNRYTAAIIDLSLPGMDGWTLLRNIQNNPRTAGLPCFAITAYHAATVAQQALQAGFTAYFPKPLQVESFVDDLSSFLPA
jgi:two-component system, chemotaxis family, CheB/CheR fusion protein